MMRHNAGHSNNYVSNCFYYRHSLIYAVNVGTHKKMTERENHVIRGYLVVLKGRRIE